MGAEPSKSARLILAHEAAVANNIGSEDRRQPPLDPLSAQTFSPVSKGLTNFAPLDEAIQQIAFNQLSRHPFGSRSQTGRTNPSGSGPRIERRPCAST